MVEGHRDQHLNQSAHGAGCCVVATSVLTIFNFSDGCVSERLISVCLLMAAGRKQLFSISLYLWFGRWRVIYSAVRGVQGSGL